MRNRKYQIKPKSQLRKLLLRSKIFYYMLFNFLILIFAIEAAININNNNNSKIKHLQ